MKSPEGQTVSIWRSNCVEIVRKDNAVVSRRKERVLRSRLCKGQTRAGRGSVLWKGLRRRSSKGKPGIGRGRVLGRVCEEGCWRVRCEQKIRGARWLNWSLRRSTSSIYVGHICKLERSLYGRDVWFVTEVIYQLCVYGEVPKAFRHISVWHHCSCTVT